MKDTRLLDIARANYPLVEKLYEQYCSDPKSVSGEWIEVFKELELLPQAPEFTPEMIHLGVSTDDTCRIQHLIQAYRTWGYLAVPVNPIALSPPKEPPQLSLEALGFSNTELAKEFPTEGLLNKDKAPLLEILQALQKIYCQRIGYEYVDHQSAPFEQWIKSRIEVTPSPLRLSIEQKQRILEQLNKAELLETFIHTKFPGQKRFSIEGGETLIPILSSLIEKGVSLGADEYILGMSHRGRLNVLANILDKPYADIFYEFDEGYFPDSFEGSGDVKYHKGFLSESVTFHGHPVKITLMPNSSHLESIDAVVEGQVKATQIKRGDVSQDKIIPVLVHGDAAISGQGVLYETLQLSQLSGFSTGGTIHIVINNQIGFTTLPKDARSTQACTDISKAFGCPVFHVNAEDPEACVFAAYLAAEIRNRFHIDLFIDLNCYRKYGHNEGDEPAFTQPIEYNLIRKKKSIRSLYQDQLIQEGVIEKFLAEGLEVEFKKALQDALREVSLPKKRERKETVETKPSFFTTFNSAVPKTSLQEAAKRYCTIPPDFKIHPKLEHLLKERMDMVLKDKAPIDWGMGETLAFATLLFEGIHIRLSGQDSGRGTFSHRHALWMDQSVEDAYFPLSHLSDKQGRSDIVNSPLSEFAVLGFEYGYSLGYPEALVLWEAQFGDFSNGAQVIIDAYISSAEAKWGQKSSLTLLLPHGYEGQGPEHSSTRLERYLSLAGNDNMMIAQPTTPAQFFHLLRRQVLAGLYKPLICLTPKQLLRHNECVSTLNEFEKGGFEGILNDPKANPSASRLVFCTGKIYYEITQFRAKEKIEDMALIRLEQLYPLDTEKLSSLIKSYPHARRFIWVQEEPSNMGAWNYIRPQLESLLPKQTQLEYIGRDQSASPATGSYQIHKKELTAILQALLIEKKPFKVEVSPFHPA